MPVKQDLAGKLGWIPIGSVALKKLAEQKCLALQPQRARIGREQIPEFIAKDGSATWFQNNHRQACINCAAQRLQNLLEILFRAIEHAKVIQRATAAEMLLRNQYVKAGS